MRRDGPTSNFKTLAHTQVLYIKWIDVLASAEKDPSLLPAVRRLRTWGRLKLLHAGIQRAARIRAVVTIWSSRPDVEGLGPGSRDSVEKKRKAEAEDAPGATDVRSVMA